MPHPENQKLTHEDLGKTSEMLWGNPVYGTVAERWMQIHAQRHARGKVLPVGDGTGALRVQMGYGVSKDVADKERILATARDLVPLSPYLMNYAPLTSAELSSHRGGPEPRYSINPIALAVRPLAAYIVGNGFDRHRFHGSYGKALDTLRVISGVTDPSDIDHSRYEHDGPFIDFHDLKKVLSESPTSASQQRGTVEKVRSAVFTQASKGQVGGWGEIVFEGAVNPTTYPYTYEQVAHSSLLVVAQRCHPNNPMGAFLRDYFGEA